MGRRSSRVYSSVVWYPTQSARPRPSRAGSGCFSLPRDKKKLVRCSVRRGWTNERPLSFVGARSPRLAARPHRLRTMPPPHNWSIHAPACLLRCLERSNWRDPVDGAEPSPTAGGPTYHPHSVPLAGLVLHLRSMHSAATTDRHGTARPN
jgi:hypothetical protein